MARRRQDLLGKLTDPFEEALQKLPSTQQFVKAATGLRDRVDDLAKRIGRLDELEKRVRDLEKRVNQLSGTSGTSGRRSTGAAAKRKTTASRAKTTRSSGSGTTRRTGGTPRRRRSS